MITRATSGLVFVIVLTGAIVYSSLSLGFIFLVFTLLGILEYFKLQKATNAQAIVGTFLGLITYSLLYFISIEQIPFDALLYLIPLIIAVYLIELFRPNMNPQGNTSVTVWSVLYIAVPFALVSFLSMMNGSYEWHLPMGLMVLIWSADTFAYLVGSFLGKNKLFEKISPKKSWEGYVGGFVMSLATAYIIAMFDENLSQLNWMVIGFLIGALGPLGDLLESKMKRAANIKDSGNIMPGHGGVLDRFDTLIFITPMVWFYLKMWA